MASAVRPAFIAMLLLAPLAGAVAQEGYDPEARIEQLGLKLPPQNSPVANYVRAVRTGNLLFVSGHGECGTPFATGKAGGGVTLDSAYAAARRVGLCLLSSLKVELGDLRRVKRIVRVTGMVNATPDFADHPKVLDGCSDLMVAVFGDRGRHARSVVGTSSLPFNRIVSIELIVEIDDRP